MATDWKVLDCSECHYNVDGACRRFPPGIRTMSVGLYTQYPRCKNADGEYSKACAEYKWGEMTANNGD